ncbi:MAG: hypothetical protein EBT78_15210 [Betaproteobacteria bacterium]|nr:hypothetical protein [Betaproteobacteria bacterium]
MRIKNWNKFQHFKDRKPPWVKLYRDVLDDLEWYELDPLASKVLVMCWLIASEDDGNLPSTKNLAFRLRMTEKQTNDCLNKLSHWLERSDINAISEQYQSDSLETETETETKKRQKATVVATPDGVSQSVWDDFKTLRKAKKAPITQRAVDGIIVEANKAGWSLEQALTECVVRGWQSFKAEWVADKPKLVNRFDVATTTVPSKQGLDPALVKLNQDKLKVVPPSPEILAKLQALRVKT